MPDDKTKFSHIEHTADVGIKIFGATRTALFENAAEGLFDIITNLKQVRIRETRRIALVAGDGEELLVRWLSELNYIFLTEMFLPRRFHVLTMSETEMTAEISGEHLNPAQHVVHTEVKAVTYHGLYLRRESGAWQAQVIFDL